MYICIFTFCILYFWISNFATNSLYALYSAYTICLFVLIIYLYDKYDEYM